MSPDIEAEFPMIPLPAFLWSFLQSTFASAVVAAAAIVAALMAAPASGSVILSGTGLSASAPAVPLAAQAEFTLTGTTLTIVLSNTSPDSSTKTDQMLSGFYFDIVKNGQRPVLTYASAEGFVWKLRNNAPDEPYNYTPPLVAGGPGTFVLADGNPTPHVASNLVADKANDRTWQFRDMNPAAAPFLGFGLGTVANSLFGGGGGNGFTESIVGPPGPDFIAFSIYKNGDIQPVGKPVTNQFMVLNAATFTFTSPDLAHYTLADISPAAVFGFGTGPDTVIVVPEPAALVWVAAGLGLAWLGRRRRSTTRRWPAACLRPGGLAPTVTATTLLALAGPMLLPASRPVGAQDFPIVLIDNEYDFAKGPEGWKSQTVAYFSPTKPVIGLNNWKHVAADGVWQVVPKPVMNENFWIGNYLTSPVIEVTEVVDVLEFNIIHRYNFPTNITSGDPITAGQVAYRIFNDKNPTAAFQPFLPGSFASGLVPPPFDERTSILDWDVPSFVTPSGLLPLIEDGLAWTGESPDFSGNAFVASRAMLRNLVPGDLVEFRLINANLGRNCADGVWDVSYVRVNGLFLPEPDGVMLAAVAAGLASAAGLARRLLPPASPPGLEPERQSVDEHAAAGVGGLRDRLVFADQALLIELVGSQGQAAEPKRHPSCPHGQPIVHLPNAGQPEFADERGPRRGGSSRNAGWIVDAADKTRELAGPVVKQARLAEAFDPEASAGSPEDRVEADLHAVEIVVCSRGDPELIAAARHATEPERFIPLKPAETGQPLNPSVGRQPAIELKALQAAGHRGVDILEQRERGAAQDAVGEEIVARRLGRRVLRGGE
jgi:opacity protein-like surface antigen